MDLKHSASGAVESTESYIATSKSTDMITPKDKEEQRAKAGAASAPAEGKIFLLWIPRKNFLIRR